MFADEAKEKIRADIKPKKHVYRNRRYQAIMCTHFRIK